MFCGADESGVALGEVVFPEEGFGFFGWVRLEHSPDGANQTLWRFKGESELVLELSLINKQLVYSTSAPEKAAITFSEHLAEHKWYFIELYHSNTAKQNIVRYQLIL